MINLKDFTYTYPVAPEPALRGISLDVPAGQFLAIIGPNNAGKSTLCAAIAGFIPDFFGGDVQGVVNVAGRDLIQTPLAQLGGEVGLVFANPFNQITGARFTVREEMAFGLENLGCPRDEMLPRIEQALAAAGLTGLEDRSPYALSGGQQQRLAIASVMVMRPKVLVLDEPTSQLDPVGTREVFETLDGLTKSGMTVVLAEHKLEWVAVHADRVLLLHGGRIVKDGAPRDVLAAPDLEQYGLAPTRYTAAARLAVERGLAPADRPLPVTLEEAVSYFGG